jgi:hypothetical protein
MNKIHPLARVVSRFSFFGFQISFLPFCFAASVFLAAFLPVSALAQAPTFSSGKQAVLAQADQLLAEMSKITGLPIKGPLKKKILSREEIREFLENTLNVEYPPEQIHREEATLKAFGLISRDFKLRDFLLTFYTEQAAGVYDPRSKTMIIADWPSEDMQRLALAHELTHALQDQNFDLLSFIHAQRDNDDASAARQAVMEGHATAAMMQRLLEGTPLAALPSLQPMLEGVIRQQFTEYPAFNQAPYFFRLQALFPYIHGMGFVQKVLQAKGGWENLDTIFREPPAQTREIFEPNVYLLGQAPERIALPRPPLFEGAVGLRRVDENSMGELGTMSILGQFISEEEAKALAPQWRADRYIVYEDKAGGNYALVSRSRWSGSESALAFFRHAHTILAKKYPDLSPDPRSTADLFIGTVANGKVIVLRKENDCRWAEGVPPNQVDAMLKWLETS